MCTACQELRINGIRCHETGCPEAWKDYKVKCKWCGTLFQPEERHQKFCCECCANNYHGWPCTCDICIEAAVEEDPSSSDDGHVFGP